MKRKQFEHVIRAAADIVDDDLVVIGSQAVLGEHPDAPSSLLKSMEVDLYPRGDPSRADDIDGVMGDGSRFHQTYGYYAQGVGPETPIAPAGWQKRLVKVEVRRAGRRNGTVIAWCLEKHDLVLAKLAAGRPHDMEFAEGAIREGLVQADQLTLGAELMPKSHQTAVRQRLDGLLARIDRSSE
jgi:hypothetical protein